MVRPPGLELPFPSGFDENPGPDPWQGSIIAPRQRTL